LFVLVIFAVVAIILVSFFIASLSKNFGLRSLVKLFVLLPFGVVFENVESILNIDVVV